ncbi:MAG: hypothetical protein K0U93_28090, partial [Gammaproteobacteria bacterium]|nr:hypothetical protein [Gammaproteobacteria bacterium]
MMRLVRKTVLHFREGRSDKVYEVDLLELDGDKAKRFVVNVRYGRRGGRLREGTKTVDPVIESEATEIFGSVVVSKLNGGYRETQPGDGVPRTERAEPIAAPARAEQVLKALNLGRDGALRDAALGRAVLRAGELQLGAAAPLMHDLVHRSRILDYCVAWALGRIGDAAMTQTVELIRSQRPDDSAGFMATQALHDLADEERIDALSAELLAQLPESLRATMAWVHADASALRAAVVNLVTSPTEATSDQLTVLYWLAHRDASVRDALIAALRIAPLTPNVFKGLRRIYKHAEYRLDGVVLGIVAHRIDCSEHFVFVGGYDAKTVRLPGQYRYVEIAKEAAKTNSRVAFSNRTRDYFRRRTWRTLRRLGDDNSSSYVPMALGVLQPFGEADAHEPRRAERTRWESIDGRWQPVVISSQQYGPLAPYLALNQILYRHSAQQQLAASRTAFVQHEQPDPDSARTEAYPHLWDAQPKFLVELLLLSELSAAHAFARRALASNESFLATVTFREWTALLRSPVLETVQFAFERARPRFNTAAPDIDFLVACLSAPLPVAREFAQDWISAHVPDSVNDVTLLYEMLSNEVAEVRQWAIDVAGHHTLSADATAPLVARLVALLLSSATPAIEAGLDGADTQRLDDIGRALREVLGEATAKVSITVLEDLCAHSIGQVRLQGARLFALRDLSESAGSGVLLARILDDERGDVRAVGVGILNQLGDEELAKHVELIGRFLVADAAEVRAAARPLLGRLCERDPDLVSAVGNELVQLLFRTERFEGLNDDILSLLDNELRGYSDTIDV